MKPVTKEDLKGNYERAKLQAIIAKAASEAGRMAFLAGLVAGTIGGFSMGYIVSRNETTQTVCERTCREREKVFLRHTVEAGCVCIPSSMIED